MITYLKWDSEFFDKKIGLITVDTGESADSLLKKIKSLYAKKFDCGYLEIAADKKDLWQYCKEKKFLLSTKRVILRKKTRNSQKDNQFVIKDKPADEVKKEIVSLSLEIAKTSRFYTDPNFKPLVGRLYKVWISKTLANLHLFKLFYSMEHDMVTGIITLRKYASMLHVDLFGVHPAFRGKGVGKALLAKADNWAKSRGFNHLHVKTQGENLKALNAYLRHGFTVYKTSYIFHIWTKHDKNTFQ